MKCKNCNYDQNIISCTVDENGLHHSFNDEPAVIVEGGAYIWCKHEKLHREYGPCYISTTSYDWNINGEGYIFTFSKESKGVILITGSDKKYNNKVAIVLKHMKEYDPTIYFCLLDNKKIYIKCLNQ